MRRLKVTPFKFMQQLPQYLALVSAGRVSEVNLTGRHLADDAMQDIINALSSSGHMVKVLDLEGNNFTSIALIALCEYLNNNESIKEINFVNNKASTVGAERVLLLLNSNNTITSFDLSQNDISGEVLAQIDYAVKINSQPTALKKMLSKLPGYENTDNAATTLDLSNSAGKLSLQLLAQAVRDTEQVEALSLARCGLGDPGLELVGTIINSRKNLRHLDLSGNGIGTHGCKVFSDHLATNTTIKNINFTDNKISDDAARYLIAALSKNDTIVELTVTDNAITASMLAKLEAALDINRQPTALKRAMQAMEADLPTVTAVELQWHKNTSRAGYFLGSALRLSSHVTVLNLSNAGLACTGAADLAAGLKFNKALVRLDLANNLIKDEGATTIIEAVRRHPSLKELNLANNLLENAAGRATLDMLGINDTIIALNLEMNHINDDLMTEIEGLVTVNQQPLGIKRILHRIESNDPTLKDIDFSEYDGDRYHTSDSVRVLCIALSTNSSVQLLDLSNNGIGDIGAQCLADYILQTTSLTTLKLNNVSISDRGAGYLVQALHGNSVTAHVEVAQNALTDLSGQALLSLLISNTTITSIKIDRTRISPEVAEELRVSTHINSEPLTLKAALHRIRGGSDKPLHISLAAPADGRKLSTEGIRILCAELTGNPLVDSIDLSNNQLSVSSVAHIARLLHHPGNKIHTLVIASNATVADDAAQVLAEAIEKSEHLHTLDIRATGVTGVGVQRIADALKVNRSVTSIMVNRDKLPSGALTALSRELALNTQVCSLKDILPRVQNNDPSVTSVALREEGGVPVDDLSCQLLSLALQHNSTVHTIDLANNNITSAGVEYLVDMLQDNKTVTTLILAGNRIDDAGCQLIKGCLEVNDALVSIDLSDNKVSEQDIADLNYLIGINNGPLTLKSVMFALSKNDPKVTEVDFNGLHEGVRPFDDEAIHILCSLLVGNTHLTAIDLANNSITDYGASLLADMLRVNQNLGSLFLENNYITRPGADALFQALKSNHTLHTLSLDGNSGIPPIVLENLTSVLNVNKQPLKELRRLGKRDVAMLDNETLFKDAGYMKDAEDTILEQAFVGAPKGAVPASMKMRQLRALQ